MYFRSQMTPYPTWEWFLDGKITRLSETVPRHPSGVGHQSIPCIHNLLLMSLEKRLTEDERSGSKLWDSGKRKASARCPEPKVGYDLQQSELPKYQVLSEQIVLRPVHIVEGHHCRHMSHENSNGHPTASSKKPSNKNWPDTDK